MTYYLDTDWRVHTEPVAGATPWVDTEGFFDGKCAQYIEGYRVVPAGQRWARADGATFAGEMITPAVALPLLLAAQAAYAEAAGTA
jgi:hypothetical protein